VNSRKTTAVISASTTVIRGAKLALATVGDFPITVVISRSAGDDLTPFLQALRIGIGQSAQLSVRVLICIAVAVVVYTIAYFRSGRDTRTPIVRMYLIVVLITRTIFIITQYQSDIDVGVTITRVSLDRGLSIARFGTGIGPTGRTLVFYHVYFVTFRVIDIFFVFG